MQISKRRIAAACAVTATLAMPATAQNAFDLETVTTGLSNPWAIAFLPGSGDMIITLRGGDLVLLDQTTGQTQPVSGAPDVDTRGQGGLLDIAPAPDFADSGLVYMTWAGRVGGQNSTTHLGRARLDRDASALVDLEVLHSVSPAIDSGAHFGSRIVFSDGHVFAGFGDRGSKDFGPDHISQDLSSENGAVIRLTMDGEIPADNPFAGDDGAAGAIWSYGHRNIQAITLHPDTGDIWLAEHGEAGGDEVNIVERGGNYGWPLAANGVTYRGGERFAEPHQDGDGFIGPAYVWPAGRDDHFPPSGMTFYTGDAFPDWQGHLLIGNLFHQYLGLFDEDGGTLEPVARLLDGEGHRIRDVAVDPQDGLIYVLADGDNVPLMRLVPAQ